ncbi:hypothetical protein MMC13_007934 [Lambiella insularis]|nr:hypothetical protein [Lambiella insularis]
MQTIASLMRPWVNAYLPPWLMNSRVYDVLGESPGTIQDTFPLPTFMFAKKSNDGLKLPQTVAHRGYKAKHPENTMGAFRGAVAAGADAIETDVHLTKDGVVVLSHDGTLERCYGKKARIIDCNWEEVSGLRTLREPHEAMPRLRDLLEYLASPGTEHIWLLLDIKFDVDADTIMRLISEVLRSVPPHPQEPWEKRVVLGCWAVKYLPLCAKYLPAYSVTHIGFTTSYAHQFLSVPHISFNLLQKSLYFSISFLRTVQAAKRPVILWTVNEDSMMRWSINKGVDGVITDDPKRFKEVTEEWIGGERQVVVDWRAWFLMVWIQSMALTFRAMLWYRSRAKKGKS